MDIFRGVVIRLAVFHHLSLWILPQLHLIRTKQLYLISISIVFTTSSLSLPPLAEMPKPTKSLNQILFSDANVYEQLNHLDVSKTKGIDGTGPVILKFCAPALYQPLHHLFSLTLSNSTLPREWFTYYIIPIYKSGEKSMVNNYRPISLLCSVSTILE